MSAVSITDAAIASPLPLRLTAFEAYMLVDDRPDYPMAFVVRLIFSGSFDALVFRRALGEAIKRHPLLAAHVEGSSLAELRWTAADEPTPFCDIGPEGAPWRYPAGESQIDLRRSTGLRVWVREGADRTEARFQFHHACCDGFGAQQFIEDVCCAYHRELYPDHDPMKPLDPLRLRGRDGFGLTRLGLLRRLPAELWSFVVGWITFFYLRPTPLATPDRPPSDPERRCCLTEMPSLEFDAGEFKRLRAAAKGAGVPLHDWLLCDVYRAVDGWNMRHSAGRTGRLVRMMVPFDLRTVDDGATPAANIVGMVKLDRWMRLRRSRARELRHLALEIRIIKKFRMAIANIRICQLLRAVPGALERQVTKRDRCYATAAFSYAAAFLARVRLPRREGKLTCGGLVIESIEAAPPIREGTHAAIAALTYAGRLQLMMNYDRDHLTADDARALLEAVAEQIRSSLPVGDGEALPGSE